jgi:gas vesicle protein
MIRRIAMPTRPAKTAENVAESVTDTVKSLIDRLVEAELTKEIARRGQDVAGVIAERGADVGERAGDVWRETRPVRRDAAKRVAQATGEAAKVSRGAWRGSIAPALKDLWDRRTVAAGAAGAAVPVSRELIESAAIRLGIKERQREEERRRWGIFFLGLVLGAAAGAVLAMLTTPRRGSEVRRQLGERAEDVRREIGARADQVAARAREAEWMAVFQREGGEGGNGHTTASAQPSAARSSRSPSSASKRARTAGTGASGSSSTGARSAGTGTGSRASGGSGRATRRRATESAAAGAADSGTSGGPATGANADRAAADTAEAINDAYDVDREPTS